MRSLAAFSFLFFFLSASCKPFRLACNEEGCLTNSLSPEQLPQSCQHLYELSMHGQGGSLWLLQAIGIKLDPTCNQDRSLQCTSGSASFFSVFAWQAGVEEEGDGRDKYPPIHLFPTSERAWLPVHLSLLPRKHPRSYCTRMLVEDVNEKTKAFDLDLDDSRRQNYSPLVEQGKDNVEKAANVQDDVSVNMSDCSLKNLYPKRLWQITCWKQQGTICYRAHLM